MARVNKNVVESYALLLTADEVRAVRDVIARVNGGPLSTRRRHIASIAAALDEAGVTYQHGQAQDLTGTISFLEEPK